jgi:hypothetical protein
LHGRRRLKSAGKEEEKKIHQTQPASSGKKGGAN